MKKIALALLTVLTIGLVGCENETTRYIEIDNPPATPQGVWSLTGDNMVTVFWLPVQDADLDHYEVWWSADDIEYEYVASADTTFYIDDDVDNGTTYYYAVLAVDRAGHESDLSYETVFDTPRPEGRGITITDFRNIPEDAGFDFSLASTVRYDNPGADIYLEYDDILETFFLNVANVNTDIQDMGFTYEFDEIGYAPDSGWSQVGWVEVIQGHTYIIWTDDNHFAKIRPYAVFGTYGVQVQWAYQTDIGNLELARPQHDNNYTGRTIGGTLLK